MANNTPINHESATTEAGKSTSDASWAPFLDFVRLNASAGTALTDQDVALKYEILKNVNLIDLGAYLLQENRQLRDEGRESNQRIAQLEQQVRNLLVRSTPLTDGEDQDQASVTSREGRSQDHQVVRETSHLSSDEGPNSSTHAHRELVVPVPVAVTVPAEEKQKMMTEIRPYLRRLYHSMIGMNYDHQKQVVNEKGFLKYQNCLPRATESGTYVIPETGAEVYRPDLLNPDSASCKLFMKDFPDTARAAIRKEIPTSVINEVIAGFIKTRKAGQRQIEDPAIGRQRKISQSESRRKQRMQWDLKIREKFWDDSPLAELPRADQLKELILDMSTIPERLGADDTYDWPHGVDEFWHYAGLAHAGESEVYLLREVDWLPPNLKRIATWYDSWCRNHALKMVTKGATTLPNLLASTPRAFWEKKAPKKLPGNLKEADMARMETIDYMQDIRSKNDPEIKRAVQVTTDRLDRYVALFKCNAPQNVRMEPGAIQSSASVSSAANEVTRGLNHIGRSKKRKLASDRTEQVVASTSKKVKSSTKVSVKNELE